MWLRVYPEVSPDGLTWCNEGMSIEINQEHLVSFPLREFGSWLRLRCHVSEGGTSRRSEDDNSSAKVTIYLALKE